MKRSEIYKVASVVIGMTFAIKGFSDGIDDFKTCNFALRMLAASGLGALYGTIGFLGGAELSRRGICKLESVGQKLQKRIEQARQFYLPYFTA